MRAGVRACVRVCVCVRMYGDNLRLTHEYKPSNRGHGLNRGRPRLVLVENMSALSTFWKRKIFKLEEKSLQIFNIYNSADCVYTLLRRYELSLIAVCIRTVWRVLDYLSKSGTNYVAGRSRDCCDDMPMQVHRTTYTVMRPVLEDAETRGRSVLSLSLLVVVIK